MQTDSSNVLVKLQGLSKEFVSKRSWWQRLFSSAPQKSSVLKAVDGVDLEIRRGEIFGLAGESGCGKSTLGRVLLRLQEATAGKIFFSDRDITHLTESEMRPLRREMQIIFQDPYASLNPRMTVASIIGEALKIHNLVEPQQRKQRIIELLETVGLHAEAMEKYPHEFSGGQRQRIGIARALAVQPKFIVADEPVSALDVSIQAQIVNLLKELQEKFSLTYLLISHDLDLLEFVCDRVAVMYLGRIMELLPARDMHKRLQHPYARALVSAIPHPDPRRHEESVGVLAGEANAKSNNQRGCVFYHRCPMAIANCQVKTPVLREIAPGHWLACDLL